MEKLIFDKHYAQKFGRHVFEIQKRSYIFLPFLKGVQQQHCGLNSISCKLHTIHQHTEGICILHVTPHQSHMQLYPTVLETS